ncbi:MAG: protein nirF [Deltaproteobacteria bacterium RBG_16_71_12]|nr:MAG: protein nirF [Deltaproteobacteria bacterium RBG_16_71_12]
MVVTAACASAPRSAPATLRGTGDLGLIVERAAGRVLVVEHSGMTTLATVEGLGDLSHASVVFSRDGRFGYVFGRDGGLSKVDLLEGRVVARIVQAGNSIGGAISQDGALVAVSNYEPGGVKVFRASDLSFVADIPALDAEGKPSKVVGLVDLPGQRFAFSLFEAGEVWVADLSGPTLALQKFPAAGREPYDGLVTGDGRFYVAGLFGEDGVAVVDLWHPEGGVTKVLPGLSQGEAKLPVYKMPHLEGWAVSSGLMFVPGVGRHEVWAVRVDGWQVVKRIPVHGQPVFAVANPAGRQVWVNFALPDNDTVQVIDVDTLEIVRTLTPGKGVLHLEFTPRGDAVWLSVRDLDKVEVYSTRTFESLCALPADKPSGIFFTSRAARPGF